MNKTFKKAIAVILSVLMVVLSVPFTALAAPGDYEPNAKLSFSMFTEAYATNFTDYSTSATAGSDFESYASLYGVPVDYNYKVVDGNKTSGTLSINKDKGNTYIDSQKLEWDKLSEDIQLGVGDYFTMTLSFEGLSNLAALQSQIQFSDSIEPAGVYSYKSGKATKYAFGTETERAAAKGTWATGKGGTTFLPKYSLCSSGVDKDAFDPTLDPNTSHISANDEDGKMNVISYEFGGKGFDVSSLSDPDGYFVNPETGDSGYTFTNNPPIATFVFKIVTDDPIEFNVYHPSNLNSIALATAVSEAMSQYRTTYAKNVYNEDTNTNDGDTEHPGSRKITFMGFNEFNQPSTYTIKFKDAAGVTVSTQKVNAGEKPTVPETNTKKAFKSDNAGNHTVTSYSWPTVAAATEDKIYEEVATSTTSACSYSRSVTTYPTYKTKGEAKYTCECGYSYTGEIDKLDGDAYTKALKDAQNVDSSKYTEASYAKVKEALDTYKEETVSAYTSQEDIDTAKKALEDAVNGLVALPTTETYTYKFINGETKTKTVNMAETPVNYDNSADKITDNKNGTHTRTTYSWSQDGYVFTEVGSDTVENCTLNHEPVTPPTIKAEGSEAATCPVCGYVSTRPIDKLDGTAYHAALEAAQSKNADDYTAASFAKVTAALNDYAEDVVAEYTDPAQVAEATKALEDAVAQLDAGVVVTVASTTLGTTTLNDADATKGASARLAVGDDVVLTAKANNETGEFVGWKVGSKIVSDEETFKTAAVSDITYEAVFAEKADESFTIVFVDPYGNVIDTQTVDSAADIQVPTEPVLPGYTFTGWSMTPEQISKLTDGATITAQYKKDEVAKYTVTVPEGATLTVDGAETTSPALVAYDAKVSVHKDGAQAWKIADGTVVGYGDTYTFFVGSDIELTVEMTAVEKTTTIAIVDAKQMENSHKVIFNATRTVIPGETVVQQGFVYGKNLADSELTLANVGNKGAAANAGNVKVVYNKNSAEQIALSYGLTSQNGKISAVAFVITKNNQTGELTTVYSNVMPFTYGA